MNANDLPPAARLACLIEAAVAANPDLKRTTAYYTTPFGITRGEAMTGGCALCMATLGAGATRDEVMDEAGYSVSYRLLSFAPRHLLDELEAFNFRARNWDAVLRALREGELAKVAA